jgi:hypothetical protein
MVQTRVKKDAMGNINWLRVKYTTYVSTKICELGKRVTFPGIQV